MESKDLSFWIDTILHIGSKTIGVIHHRSHAISLLQSVGIEHGLVLAYEWIFGGALGFDDCQWFHGIGEEHIVGITNLGIVRHTIEFNLYAGFACQ